MLRHVVLLKFQPGTSEKFLDGLVSSLRALPESVQCIQGYNVTRDLGLAADNADIAVIGDFVDVDGYLEYSAHPAHRRIIEEQILPRLASRTATQFDL